MEASIPHKQKKGRWLQSLVTLPTKEKLEQVVELERTVNSPNQLYLFGKRAIDVLVSFLALVVLSPLMLVAGLMISLESPGPAIFRQVRIGKGGRLFTLYKFRGMYVDARERWPHLYAYDYSSVDGRGIVFHIKDDPRVTRVARALRSLSIDEFPNFWNVLKGDISLVGPRPQIPEMMKYYGKYKEIIQSAKPGIFSLPKVMKRDGMDLLETNQYDAWYAQNCSFILDLYIILKGFVIVFRRQNVFH